VEIVIIGAGGHGSELYSYLHDMSAVDLQIHMAGFVDEGKPSGRWNEAQILGGFDDLQALLRAQSDSAFGYITAVGNNELRRTLVEKAIRLRAPNLRAWTLIHPGATVGRDVIFGEGTCAAPGSIVTTRVRVGRHSILNVKASVSHDCVIGDFVNINPGAVIAGNVHVGDGCFIGAGSTIIENVSIGEWAVIGAGAVVIDDIPPYCTAVGVPARIIKQPGWKEARVGSR